MSLEALEEVKSDLDGLAWYSGIFSESPFILPD
jgi:hypothetical protein